MYSNPFSPKIMLPVFLIILMLTWSAAAYGHGGGLDAYGCHHNRKLGGYHCHRGIFAGQFFSSKEEMLQQLRVREKPSPEQQTVPQTKEKNCVEDEKTKQIVYGQVVK